MVGAEAYLRDQFRQRLLAALDPESIPLSWIEEDLEHSPLEEILDRACTPSLLAPMQIFWVRNARELFGRGARDIAGPIGRYLQAQAPATVVLIADHIHLPADRQRIGLEDKTKLLRIEEVLGPLSELVFCAAVPEAQAALMAQEMARRRGHELGVAEARRLAESQSGSLALIEREIEKLAEFVGAGSVITDATIEALVPAARTSSAYELATLLARGNCAASMECLSRLWADEGDSGAIGLVFQLSRAFSMALILRQHGVRDRSSLYRVLPDGLKPPGFAADTVLGLAARMPDARLRQGVALMARADIELRSSPLSARLVFERAIFALTAAT